MEGVIRMPFNGNLVLYLIIAVVATLLAVALKHWGFKLGFFIVALGAATIVAGITNLGAFGVLLISVVLTLATGFTSVRVKGIGNKVLGVILIIVGLFLIIPTVAALNSATPGQVADGISASIQTGWATLVENLQRVFGST